MKYADIANIWIVELELLSKADRGRVYFERSKQVVAEALADSKLRQRAVEGKRFRRSYLIEKIGCRPSVTTQNPRIKALLSQTDKGLQKAAKPVSPAARQSTFITPVAEVIRLLATIETLQGRLQIQELEISKLRAKVHNAGGFPADE